jgi:hypothetical protein
VYHASLILLPLHIGQTRSETFPALRYRLMPTEVNDPVELGSADLVGQAGHGIRRTLQ